MSNLNNQQILEDAQADFDSFLVRNEWGNAQAVIDHLFEQGFESEATQLRKNYLQAQKDWADARDGFAVAEEKAETPFEQKKRTLCPEVNCTDPTCQFMHD